MNNRHLSLSALLALACFAMPPSSLSAAEDFVIFLIGDSTMADKPVIPENPERGWGQLLPLYFESNASVDNHAASGRSSKSFRSEGKWNVVLDRMRPGDWVIIQFGHNDAKPDEARHTEPFTTYTESLQRYVLETRERGGQPILATPIVRRRFDEEGKLQPTHGQYPTAVRRLSEKMHVPLLDMTHRSRELLTELGKTRSELLFLWTVPGEYKRFPDGNSDDTHLNALGASRMCDLAVDEIIKKIPGLAIHLRDKR